MTIIKAGANEGWNSAIKWKFGSGLKCAEMSFDPMSHDVSRFFNSPSLFSNVHYEQNYQFTNQFWNRVQDFLIFRIRIFVNLPFFSWNLQFYFFRLKSFSMNIFAIEIIVRKILSYQMLTYFIFCRSSKMINLPTVIPKAEPQMEQTLLDLMISTLIRKRANVSLESQSELNKWGVG